MPTEFEAKVLDIDPDAMAGTILARGGRRVSEAMMRRYVYDIVAGDENKWIRLRDNGDEVTLTVKEIAHDGIDGTRETEVVVSDFGTTDELLRQLGFRPKAYQENRRISLRLEGAALEIDTWPMIPAYLEIEAESRPRVVEVARLLGVDEDRLTGENTVKVYARFGIDLDAHPDLRFPEGR
jgi:adenylate cyclase class 2